LKLIRYRLIMKRFVAPPAGAWIETFPLVEREAKECRAPRGRVD